MEEELTVKQLMAGIKDRDAEVRAAAWQSAGKVGTAAVGPLAKLMAQMDAGLAQLTKGSGSGKDDKEQLAYQLEVGRAAKRGLWVIVRHAGRPGADDEKKPVEGRLCNLLGGDQPLAVQREVLWMLSEIGGRRAIEAIRNMPGILENKDLREDARCAVERIPGEAATQALVEALENSGDDFRLAIAHSLRVRGVEVDKKRYPPQKLIPMQQTKVVPVS